MVQGMERTMFQDDTAFVDRIARRGVELRLSGDRLYVRDSKNVLTQEEREKLRRRKFSLVRTLRRKQSARELATSWAEWQRRPQAAQVREAPLTPYQEIFALLTSQGEHAVVNQVGVFDLALPVCDANGELVQEALHSLMVRHPMLRMRVVSQAERENECSFPDSRQRPAMLEIVPSCPLPVTILCKDTDWDREATIETCRRSFRTAGYDLAQAPLWRAAIFPHPRHCRSTLVIGLHHIIMDGWSMGLLAGELAHLLDSLPDWPAEQTPLPVTYPSYAAWLAQEGLPAIRKSQTAFWADLVQTVPQCHRIPSDYLRASGQKAGHGLCRATIPTRARQELQRFAASRGCSLFAALHTALRLLLYRTCGQTHAPILTVAANRQLPGLERVVGCFVNVLPLVCPFNPSLSMAENMRQSQDCLVHALDHQMLPFQEIVAAARVERSRARHPVSQIFLTLQNAFASSEHGCVTARLPEEPISAYDLALVLWDYDEDGLVAHLEYDTSLYQEEHMRALLDAYADCLRKLPLQDTPESLRDGVAAPGDPGPGDSCPDAPKNEPCANLAARLAQGLGLAGYEAVLVQDAGPLADLVANACAACGCPCLAADRACAAGPAGHVLRVQTRWSGECAALPQGTDVLLVNHLPTARQLAQAKEQSLGGSLTMLLQLGTALSLVVARAQDLLSDRATHIAASTQLLQNPVVQAAYLPVQDGPARGLTSLGQGMIALPLPGGASPLLWKEGHAFNLDQVVRDLVQGPGEEQPDCALGLLVPAHSSQLSSVVREDGEMVAWAGGGLANTSILEGLPEALRPRHIMRIDHVPRRSDGSICRKSLLALPFYSPKFVRRALPGARLEALQDGDRQANVIHVPVPGLRCATPCMTPLRLPDHATARGNAVPAAGKACLIRLCGKSLDTGCLSLFLRHKDCRFLLAGERAAELCAELGSARVAPWTEDLRCEPIGSVVRIIDADTDTDAPACQQESGPWEGIPHLSLLVAGRRPGSAQLAKRARLLAMLCQSAWENNLHSPHTFLVFALPAWQELSRTGQTQGALSEDQASALLGRALASGKDMGIVGLEPEDMGWQSLLLRTPRPQHELVTQGRTAPHLLPHPLRNAFCETGPLRMEVPQEFTSAEMAKDDVSPDRDTPHGDVDRAMARIWNSILQTENADPDANFFDLGGTSLMAPRIQERIASTFQVDIGVAGVFLYPSLQELTMVVRSSLASRRADADRARAEEGFQARQRAARAARNNRKQVRRFHETPLA